MDVSALTLNRIGSPELYRQLSDALAGAIVRGDLQPGDRLPSERDLATRLGISRTTTVNAYRELHARGLVRGHVGRGTFVCAALGAEQHGAPFAWRGKVALGARRSPDPVIRAVVRAGADPDVISFAPGVPALECFPTEAYRELTDRILRRGPHVALDLAPTEGHPTLRRAIAARAKIRPSQVMVVAGAQQGLDLVARCLLDPGDVVIVERPGYLGAIPVFRAAGANLVGWDAGEDDLDDLEDLLIRYRPKLLYCNSTFQNPTGRTWSTRFRREVLALAGRYRLPIIEDDPYRELSFGAPPPPTLFALDEGRAVIYSGTFSKTLAGGLRLGWLAANEAIIDQLAMVKQRSDVTTASLTQLVVAELMTSGGYDAHLRTLRVEHVRRHDAMLTAIARAIPAGALTPVPVSGGVYLWCRLGPGLDSRELLVAATAAGVAFVSGDLFYPDGDGASELRLCFSGVPPSRIDDGMRRLDGAMRSLHQNRPNDLAIAAPIT